MASTTADLAKWAKHYYAGHLFSDSLALKLITPNAEASDLGEGLAFGMGSFIYSTSKGKLYGHTGFVPGFISMFGFFPERKIAVALQINCDWAAGEMPLSAYIEQILAASHMEE